MFYKTYTTFKYSFLAVSVACLLSTTALAQNTLELIDDDASSETSLNTSDDAFPASDENNGLNSGGVLLGGGLPEDNNGTEQAGLPSVNNSMGNDTMNQPYPSDNAPQQNGGTGEMSQDNNAQSSNEYAVLKAYNNFVDETDRQAFNAANRANSSFGDQIMDQVKEDLFSQMADIEKQTSLLTLELKREKIKNEIANMHAQRQKALDEQKEKQRERERKQAEWEREQEKKLLVERQKLKEMEIKFEKLRQERVLKAYKENMLKSNQEWVEYNSRLYNQLVKEEKAQNDLIAKQKEYFKNLEELISKVNKGVMQAKEKYNTDIVNLQTQIAILKSKLEADRAAYEEKKNAVTNNPFALVSDGDGSANKISEEYAIMEISGKGDVLVAKLINKNGGTFMVKPGTILNTGHIIEEITQTYIVADKSGMKDYLYFSAGGILDKEPSKPIKSIITKSDDEVEQNQSGSDNNNGALRLPSLRAGMFLE